MQRPELILERVEKHRVAVAQRCVVVGHGRFEPYLQKCRILRPEVDCTAQQLDAALEHSAQRVEVTGDLGVEVFLARQVWIENRLHDRPRQLADEVDQGPDKASLGAEVDGRGDRRQAVRRYEMVGRVEARVDRQLVLLLPWLERQRVVAGRAAGELGRRVGDEVSLHPIADLLESSGYLLFVHGPRFRGLAATA